MIDLITVGDKVELLEAVYTHCTIGDICEVTEVLYDDDGMLKPFPIMIESWPFAIHEVKLVG